MPIQKDLPEIILPFYSKLACVMSKLSVIRKLNFLESDAKISKSSKVIGESNCSSWSDITDSLVF